MPVFWAIFITATITCQIIALNMVVAVMMNAYTKVDEDNEAYIYREKLLKILDKNYFFSTQRRKRFTENKYLLLVDVQLKNDTIGKETEETRVQSEISSLRTYINWMKGS